MQQGIRVGHYHIIANAGSVPPSLIKHLEGKINVIVLDGAANNLLQNLDFTPHLIMGDFDSIKSESLANAESKNIPTLVRKQQDKTDLQKAIEHCLSQGANSIEIYNALGGRVDHSLFNLRLLKMYYRADCPITIFEPGQTLRFIKDRMVTLQGSEKELVALMAFPKATISSSGLTYEMHNYPLVFAESESVSNSLAQTIARIDIRGEAMLITSDKISTKVS